MNRVLGTGILLVLWSMLAFFTDSAAQTGGTFSDTTVVPIEGVSVTGSRVSETLLKTPSAITVVPRARIAPTRQISLADGLRLVPGVLSQSRAGGQDVRITIRGYGARGNGERSNAGNLRGIRVLTDNIPLSEPDGRTSLDLLDLGAADQVEVLRSNGSALYGNASGGVVNVRTLLDFDNPFFDFSARAGTFGFHREQGVAGYTVGGARGSLSIFNSAFDGWREHSESATTSIQNRLRTQFGEDTRLGVLMDFVSNFNRFPGPLTAAQLEDDPEQANPTFVARDERRFNRVGRVGLTLDQDLAAAQTLSLAAWVEPKVLQRSERNRFRDFTRYHIGGSALYQIQRPLGAWSSTWTAGGDDQFQDGAIQFYDLLPDGSRGPTLIQNKREAANSAGGFVQGEVKNEQWAFRVAARYDNLWYISEDRITPSLNASKHFTHVTPKGSIARFLGRHTAYAAVGGGVEAPAFNEIDPPPSIPATSLNPFLDPMLSTSYEVGLKGDLVREGGRLGRVGYDVAGYWIDVENDLVPYDGGAYYFTNGKTRRQGAELGIDWTPVTRFTLASSINASHNEYVEYAIDLGDSVVDNSSNDVSGLPDLFLDVEARFRPMSGLSVAASLRHVGDYFADDANTAPVESYELLGAEAELAFPVSFGLLRVFASADNLTDETYVASVFINGLSGQYYEPGLPRNFHAGVSVALR